MSHSWGWFVLLAVFASSAALGVATAFLLVRMTAQRAAWIFSVPFTLWWLVAGLSVAVYGFEVRVTVPNWDRAPVPPDAPLTPLGPLDPNAR